MLLESLYTQIKCKDQKIAEQTKRLQNLTKMLEQRDQKLEEPITVDGREEGFEGGDGSSNLSFGSLFGLVVGDGVGGSATAFSGSAGAFVSTGSAGSPSPKWRYSSAFVLPNVFAFSRTNPPNMRSYKSPSSALICCIF